jgi:PAS domain S-box-containing protein
MPIIERDHGKQARDEPTATQSENRTTGSGPRAADIESTLVERCSSRPDQVPRQRSVRFRLTCLVLACILPVCIIAFLFVYYSYQYKRALTDQRALEITRALSTVVDRHLALIRASATALATSPNLATGDLAAFHKQAQTVLQDYPDYVVILSDAGGRELVNTGVPFGKPLPIRGDLDVVRTVFDTGKPVTSNLYKGFRTGAYVFGVHVPVFQGNRVVYDLVFAVHAEDFQKVIFRQRIPPEWSACILDTNKVLVARSRFPERFVGRQIFPAGVKPIDERLEGTVEAPGPEGVDVFATFSRSATTGWTVVIAIPKALIWADSRRWLMWVVGSVILLSTVVLVLALFFARRISGSIQALVAPALALGRGETVEIGQLDLSEANNVGQSLVKASQLLRERTIEREWAEGELRLSEEKFAKAFAKNSAAVGITRLKDGIFLEVNDTWVELVGYSREEMIGHSSRRMIWPTRDATARCLRKLRERGWLRGWEQEFVKKSGEIFVTELSAQIWILNGKKLVVTTLVDITARKRAEEALRESESRFRAFFETAAAGTAELDVDGHFLHVNQRFCQITGYSEEELLALTPEELTHPEDRALDGEKLELFLRGDLPIYETEKRYVRKDGSIIWVQLTATMIRNDEGKPLRFAGILQDITERKRAAEVLLRNEKLATLGRMAATISHEINNPLDAVMNLQFLAKAAEGLPESARHFLEMADAELKRVAHITRQSLGFYRESTVPTLTSIGAVLDSAIDLQKSTIKAKHANIDRQWREDVRIIAVAGELRQVFSNLISNSLDAIDERGMIKLRISAHNDHVRITVADNGKGIPPSTRQHIFEPFFTTKEKVGTGLGLWVSQQIIEKHGGTIWVRSSTNCARRGTTFSVFLPATCKIEQIVCQHGNCSPRT